MKEQNKQSASEQTLPGKWIKAHGKRKRWQKAVLLLSCIAGHNYRNAFGKLFDLQIGDEVTFTDTDGNLFRYRVAELETLPASAVEEMTESTWDFTLFTCTFGGRSRLAVRCERMQ